MRPRRSLVALVALVVFPASAFADIVDGWTDTYCETVKTLIQTTAGPCRTSRSAAMMYLAMYDAVNSITRTHEPYLLEVPASANASREAAATTAAYEVMMSIYPTRAYLFDPRYAADLALIPEGAEKTEGIEIGRTIAAAIIALRSDDGSQDPVTYEPIEEPGHWRPTWPEFRAAKDPGYGRVTPFGLEAAEQFPRSAAPALDSPEYFEAWEEVRTRGSMHANTEGTLEYEIGWFWANDQDGTFKPTGHIYALTKAVADAAGLDFEERVHLFGLIGLATADAAIAAWNAKYETDWDLWRPITGIREADTDGNPLTEPDPDWVPVSFFTPNFPGHVSGHATFGGASSQILRRYFGTDEMEFVVPTADPHLAFGWTRTMYSFSQAENENADSRIYIGVHWRFDCDGGLALGRQVGDWIFDHYLRPVDGLVSALPDGGASTLLLESLWPNPTPGAATLRFATPMGGDLDVAIFDAGGRRVGGLGGVAVPGGVVEIAWDGRGLDGRSLAPGVYYVRGALDGQPLGSPGGGARLVVLR